jgi:hypothetical protein
MKKQFLMISLMVATVNFNSTHAYVDTLSFYDQGDEKAEWAFLEKAFITDIAKSKQLSWNHISAAATTLVMAGSTYQYTQTSATDGSILQQLLQPKNVFGLTSCATAAICSIQGLQCYLSHEANRTAVKNFFANYENNQVLVPASLQYAFDMIAERVTCEGMDAVLVDANDIVDQIQGMIMRYFEKRYEKVLQVSAENALATTKTAGEIIKNAVETSSKLAGGK